MKLHITQLGNTFLGRKKEAKKYYAEIDSAAKITIVISNYKTGGNSTWPGREEVNNG